MIVVPNHTQRVERRDRFGTEYTRSRNQSHKELQLNKIRMFGFGTDFVLQLAMAEGLSRETPPLAT